jgi:peptide/nickel transport system substrate-binding protein
MRRRFRTFGLWTALTVFVAACQPAQPAPTAAPAKQAPAAAPADKAAPSKAEAPAAGKAPTRVTVGVTETIESPNPYNNTDALKFGIWSEVYGTLVRQDFDKGAYSGILAESWKVESPTTWIVNLRKNARWSDGSPFTSADVTHSFDRMKNDPASLQRPALRPVARAEAIDQHTVRLTTEEPLSVLLDVVKDRPITSKAAFDQYGDKAYTEKPLSAGPYIYKELVPDQRMIIVKNPNYWGGEVQGPDELVYRVMRESEVRVTALLNNEIQIAQFIPPHMVERVTGNRGTKLVTTDGIEGMFLAMRPDSKPFDNKLVRQAVAYAIDRDAIIKGVLQGYATRLDGPIGPGRYGYNPDLQPRYGYNPEKSRQLLAQAGYPNGVDVEFYTPVNRYTQDKQLSEAIAQMLTAAGIRTRLTTPEWPTLWDNVMKGRVPFYYMGRIMFDPDNLRTYFKPNDTPRVGYVNPQVDELFSRNRAAFDPEERKKVLWELMSVILDDAPAHFLWTHKLLMGTAANIEHAPRPDDRIFGIDIRVR